MHAGANPGKMSPAMTLLKDLKSACTVAIS